MIPLKMRRLFFGFTPRRLLGINGSILAHCPSLNQNKFARICWPPIRLTNPLNLNMVNWVLTLARRQLRQARQRLSRHRDPPCSLSRLRGRVGVGVPEQNAELVVERCAHPPRSAERHSRSFASAFFSLRTAAKGGLCSPASGRGKKEAEPA